MKSSFFQPGVLALLLAGTQGVFGEPTPAVKPVPPPRSEFVQPASFREGRDPFFPESSRPFASAVAAAQTVEAAVLKAPGFSVVNGKRMAIINHRTLAVGDESDVVTGGRRVHIRCLEIRNELVVVEVDGQRQEIIFGAK